MGAARRTANEGDLLEVVRAASLVGRHPETVRRWVWSGRLEAQRSGHRLLVARADLEALTRKGSLVPTLAEWADRVGRMRGSSSSAGSGRSAADLVIEDRGRRSGTEAARADR
jgi:excisionase family DNA binding protein